MWKNGWRMDGNKMIPVDINEVLEIIKNTFEYDKKHEEYLNKRIKELEDTKGITDKNDAIREISTRSIHILSEKEEQDSEDFAKKHYESCNGRMEYIVGGTGIGDYVKVRCTKCGKEKDITDYSNW